MRWVATKYIQEYKVITLSLAISICKNFTGILFSHFLESGYATYIVILQPTTFLAGLKSYCWILEYFSPCSFWLLTFQQRWILQRCWRRKWLYVQLPSMGLYFYSELYLNIWAIRVWHILHKKISEYLSTSVLAWVRLESKKCTATYPCSGTQILAVTFFCLSVLSAKFY